MAHIAALLRKRPREPTSSSTSKGLLSGGAGHQRVVHYDDSCPFPFCFDKDFPAEAYRSRHAEVKTAIHWGQRKLLLSEIQLLSHYAKRGVSYHIVYAGSAPGTHLGFLDELSDGMHTWELIDPGQFDRVVLGPRKNFCLRNEFFTNATAYGINANRLDRLPGLQRVYRWIALDSVEHERREIHERLAGIIGTLDVARGTTDIPSMYEPQLALPRGLNALCEVAMERRPLLFVSDIRTGSVALPNFEEHVVENMRAQQTWTEILQADFAMLKFRLPYTSKASGPGGAGATASALIEPDGCVEYLDGELVIPIWTRPTSTEGRLVVPRGAARKRYNVKHVEDQFFFLNAKLRELYHFNHILSPHDALDGHFDSAAEVNCLTEYCKFMDASLEAPEAKHRLVIAVRKMVDRITLQLKLDFAGAIRRRDAMILNQAMMGIPMTLQQDDDDGGSSALAVSDASSHSDKNSETFVSWEPEARRMIQEAADERLRVVWWKNVDCRGGGVLADAPVWRGTLL